MYYVYFSSTDWRARLYKSIPFQAGFKMVLTQRSGIVLNRMKRLPNRVLILKFLIGRSNCELWKCEFVGVNTVFREVARACRSAPY